MIISYNPIAFFALFIVFIYLSIETITAGTGLTILPPSYKIFLMLGAVIFFYFLFSVRNSVKYILRNNPITIFIVFNIIYMILSAKIAGNLSHVAPEDINIFFAYFLPFVLIGLYLSMYIYDWLDKLFDKSNHSISIIIMFFVFSYLYLLLLSNNFDIFKCLYGFGNGYQGRGLHLKLSFLVTIIFLFLMNKYKNSSFIFFVVGLFLLFVLGSRSALAFYIIVYMMFLLLHGSRQVLVHIILLSLMVFLFSDTVLEFLKTRERIFALISFDTTDGSFSERKDQLIQNWKFIQENFISGLFMSENITIGKGGYIHGYLSYWQSYGILVFVSINILILRVLFVFLNNMSRQKTNDIFIFMFLCFIYTILEFIFSRSYTAHHLFMFLMLTEAYTNQLTKGDK